MSKKKLLVYALLPAIGLGILGASSVSAHGMFGGFSLFGGAAAEDIAARQQAMFQHQTKILGLSEAEVKAAWADGKNMQELMQEKGISESDVQSRVKTERLAQMKTHLDTLVSKNIITQAQADSRLKFVETQLESNGGKMGRRMHRGFWF